MTNDQRSPLEPFAARALLFGTTVAVGTDQANNALGLTGTSALLAGVFMGATVDSLTIIMENWRMAYIKTSTALATSTVPQNFKFRGSSIKLPPAETPEQRDARMTAAAYRYATRSRFTTTGINPFVMLA